VTLTEVVPAANKVGMSLRTVNLAEFPEEITIIDIDAEATSKNA
jgi:hypothetical protein